MYLHVYYCFRNWRVGWFSWSGMNFSRGRRRNLWNVLSPQRPCPQKWVMTRMPQGVWQSPSSGSLLKWRTSSEYWTRITVNPLWRNHVDRSPKCSDLQQTPWEHRLRRTSRAGSSRPRTSWSDATRVNYLFINMFE